MAEIEELIAACKHSENVYIYGAGKNASDTYTLLETLDPTKTDQIYDARQNGYYKFVIENNVNVKAEAEIEINDRDHSRKANHPIGSEKRRRSQLCIRHMDQSECDDPIQKYEHSCERSDHLSISRKRNRYMDRYG